MIVLGHCVPPKDRIGRIKCMVGWDLRWDIIFMAVGGGSLGAHRDRVARSLNKSCLYRDHKGVPTHYLTVHVIPVTRYSGDISIQMCNTTSR